MCRRNLIRYSFILLLLLSGFCATAQVEVKGAVFDRSRLFAMPGVSVLGTSGQGTVTDSTGHYSIRLHPGDSIFFSYLGRHTTKFPLKMVIPGYPFNMSLAVDVDSLPLVIVRPKLYRYDSAENREEYRKVFNYQPEYLTEGGSGGIGFNFDMLFNGRKVRQMEKLRERLLEEERDKYVDHRFNRTLVRKITGLQRPALDTFMRIYRPSYEFIQNCENDYEFYKYIKDCGIYFSKMWRREHGQVNEN